MAKQTMKVEIWSDVMCPFCYIGKRHYEAALTNFAHREEISTQWHSFQLDPTVPDEPGTPGSIFQYLAERKGMDINTSRRLHDDLTHRAAEAGLTYNFNIAIMANSFKAHTLIQFAKTKGLDDAMEESLFRAYFTDGNDISDPATLGTLAENIGLNKDESLAALTDDQYKYAANQDFLEARQIGISGVPFFVFNRRYAVSGAQPVETFIATLEKSFEEWSASQNA